MENGEWRVEDGESRGCRRCGESIHLGIRWNIRCVRHTVCSMYICIYTVHVHHNTLYIIQCTYIRISLGSRLLDVGWVNGKTASHLFEVLYTFSRSRARTTPQRRLYTYTLALLDLSCIQGRDRATEQPSELQPGKEPASSSVKRTHSTCYREGQNFKFPYDIGTSEFEAQLKDTFHADG